MTVLIDKGVGFLRRERAFTLAEVLVTLGIIGIVAAMTLPGVVAAHRSKTLEAQFKKHYSELAQMLLKLHNDADYVYGVHSATDLQNFIAENIKGAKASYRGVYALSPSSQMFYLGFTLPVYKTYSKYTDYKKSFLDDGFVAVNKSFYVYINADGGIKENMTIIMDINGEQSPNIVGYDVFMFRYDKDKSLKVALEDDSLCSVTSTSDNNGASCSYYAMNDANYFKNLGW